MRDAGTRLVRSLRALSVAAACAVAAPAAHAQSDVSISVDTFGALRAFRPGDVTGVRVRLTSRLPEPVECLLQWDLDNADGDLVSHARPVTLVPNQPVERWVYARTRPTERLSAANEEDFMLRLFQSREGARMRQIAEQGFRPSGAAQPSVPVALNQGLIAVLGADRMGLETLQASLDGRNVPSMNELTHVATGNRAADLPDRWEGLSSLEAIVWRADGPQDVGAEQARALRQWVERGGHLVIVLPDTGDAWGLRGGGGGHAMSDLLPSTPGSRVDGVSVSSLLPALAKGREMRRSDATVSMTLFSPSKLDRGWMPLVTVPDGIRPREAQGLAFVVQRCLEHGRISIVGLDLESLHRAALVTDGLPQADVFWNRVLGRRADAPTEANYRDWEEAKPAQLLKEPNFAGTWNAGNPRTVLDAIGQQGRAVGVVLVLMAFFGAYWLLAVPGVWALLNVRKRLRWSWPAFTLVALAATPVAWLIGSLAGTGSGGVRHVSVADWVLPAPGDDSGASGRLRVNAWLSASLGGFRTSEVRLGDEPSRADVLLDWNPPPEGSPSRFPDTARNLRAVDTPSVLACTSRSTSTNLQAWWLGAPPPAWKRVAWADTQPETVVLPGANPRVSIRGTLRHELPAPLTGVQIVHVTPWLWESRHWGGGAFPRIEPSDLPSRPARMVSLPSTFAWQGEPLDLEKLLYPQGPLPVAAKGDGALVTEVDSLFVSPLRGAGGGVSAARLDAPFDSADVPLHLRALGLFQLITPPEYRPGPGTSQAATVVRVQRSLGRNLDLSAWSTRPCVIVTGFMERAACPLPLRIDGETPASEGLVMVRLVFPLGGTSQPQVQPFTGSAIP